MCISALLLNLLEKHYQFNHETRSAANQHMSLTEEIISRLETLAPSKIDIQDESAMHAGHAGNIGGGHFKLEITSSHFYKKSPIMRHRIIYQLLADLIPSKIHALSIHALAPDEQ